MKEGEANPNKYSVGSPLQCLESNHSNHHDVESRQEVIFSHMSQDFRVESFEEVSPLVKKNSNMEQEKIEELKEPNPFNSSLYQH